MRSQGRHSNVGMSVSSQKKTGSETGDYDPISVDSGYELSGSQESKKLVLKEWRARRNSGETKVLPVAF